jgi:hypothetical protein
MGLDKYYQFILKPNTKTFNEFLKNILEFKKVYKIKKQKLETIIKLLQHGLFSQSDINDTI